MEEKAKNTPKKKKKPFMSMEIAKVPLDQEQAVLTCCAQPSRGQWAVGRQCMSVQRGCGDGGIPEIGASCESFFYLVIWVFGTLEFGLYPRRKSLRGSEVHGFPGPAQRKKRAFC